MWGERMSQGFKVLGLNGKKNGVTCYQKEKGCRDVISAVFEYGDIEILLAMQMDMSGWQLHTTVWSSSEKSE